MRVAKPMKYLMIAVVALALIATSFYAFLAYSLQHMQLDLSGVGVALSKLAATVELATLTIPRCEAPVDHAIGGDRRRESIMLYVATIVDLYKTTFGKLPDNIEDLEKLPDFGNADKLNGRQVGRSCSIHAYPTGSYVVACGAPLPPAKDLQAIFAKAGHVQRFQMLNGTEILYVPGGGCS
jgi:hypothetical protein